MSLLIAVPQQQQQLPARNLSGRQSATQSPPSPAGFFLGGYIGERLAARSPTATGQWATLNLARRKRLTPPEICGAPLEGLPLKRTALFVMISSALGYAAVCALLFVAQSSLIYHPRAATAGATTAMTLPVDGATLRISHRPKPGNRALIYLGGNAEDVSASLAGFSRAFPDHALYLMHYRGYGGSTGQPSEAALFADALALYDRVKATHTHITVVGRSLGSGVAVYLASQRPVSRLTLITPYDSIANVAAQRLRIIPVQWLMFDKYESWRYAPNVTAATRVLLAEADEVIPRVRSDALMRYFQPGVATLNVIPGTGHNSISQHPDYLTLLRSDP